MPPQTPAPALILSHPSTRQGRAAQSGERKGGGWPRLPRRAPRHPACPAPVLQPDAHEYALPGQDHSAVGGCLHPACAKLPSHKRGASPPPASLTGGVPPLDAEGASAIWAGG